MPLSRVPFDFHTFSEAEQAALIEADFDEELVFQIRARGRDQKDATSPCGSCHRVHHPYMVTAEVWKEAGFAYSDMRCRDCLSRALGRALQVEDFRYYGTEKPGETR
jgi:cytidine deaminase